MSYFLLLGFIGIVGIVGVVGIVGLKILIRLTPQLSIKH